MLSKWPIRNKLLFGVALLIVMLATLSASGFLGMYSYRSLVKGLSGRASELPLASSLARRVSDMRVALSEHQRFHALTTSDLPSEHFDSQLARDQFGDNLQAVRRVFAKYQEQLAENAAENYAGIGDNEPELQTVAKIQDSLTRIVELDEDENWFFDESNADRLGAELDQLQLLCAELPSHLHERFHELAGEVRSRYRTWIVLTWVTTLSAGIMLAVLIRLFYRWVFRPLRVLVKGSRRVAAGEFSYRIHLNTRDEMSELAEAMNDMTARFQAIRDDLDRQVQIRTKQVVRSEQLASVGFLAAGVAHEINNPLASIALCAESLEGRLAETTSGDADASSDNAKVARQYLRMIQNEAFRCKEITEKLLDFSRMGEVKRQTTDLVELVQSVIDMVRHLGKYQNKHIKFEPRETVLAYVNSQEMKQVVLNLITNALDSVDADGTLTIELQRLPNSIELVFRDNGCGMTDEVLKHLFEPFFTRKRGGQGTGLGLSIVYRIVADHEGHIEASSEGLEKGSQFRVTLPLPESVKETKHRYKAA